MGSLDTRLHEAEGKVRALVRSYLHHGSRLSELEARVAALESYLDTLHRAQAGGPEPAACPAPAQAACPHPHCIMQCCPLHPEQAARKSCGACAFGTKESPCPDDANAYLGGGVCDAFRSKQAACLCGHPAHPGHHCKVPLQPTGRQCGCRKYEPKQAAQPAPQQPRGGGG